MIEILSKYIQHLPQPEYLWPIMAFPVLLFVKMTTIDLLSINKLPMILRAKKQDIESIALLLYRQVILLWFVGSILCGALISIAIVGNTHWNPPNGLPLSGNGLEINSNQQPLWSRCPFEWLVRETE